MRTQGPASDILIFPAGPTDAEALARLHVTAWRETYAGLLPDSYLAQMSEADHAKRFAQVLADAPNMGVTLMAADREGLAGYAEAGRSRSRLPREGEIYTLYLLKAAHGRGVGRQLVAAAARALAAQGAETLIINVLRANAAARRFYEHLGGRMDPIAIRPPGRMQREVTYRWNDLGVLMR